MNILRWKINFALCAVFISSFALAETTKSASVKSEDMHFSLEMVENIAQLYNY